MLHQTPSPGEGTLPGGAPALLSIPASEIARAEPEHRDHDGQAAQKERQAPRLGDGGGTRQHEGMDLAVDLAVARDLAGGVDPVRGIQGPARTRVDERVQVDHLAVPVKERVIAARPGVREADHVSRVIHPEGFRSTYPP